MPEYTYRREDGSMFTMRQKFSDSPLSVDPATGQKVVRVMQPAGIIFKGSGFYINDSRSSKEGTGSSTTVKAKSDNKVETKSEAKESKSETVTKSTSDAAD